MSNKYKEFKKWAKEYSLSKIYSYCTVYDKKTKMLERCRIVDLHYDTMNNILTCSRLQSGMRIVSSKLLRLFLKDSCNIESSRGWWILKHSTNEQITTIYINKPISINSLAKLLDYNIEFNNTKATFDLYIKDSKKYFYNLTIKTDNKFLYMYNDDIERRFNIINFLSKCTPVNSQSIIYEDFENTVNIKFSLPLWNSSIIEFNPELFEVCKEHSFVDNDIEKTLILSLLENNIKNAFMISKGKVSCIVNNFDHFIYTNPNYLDCVVSKEKKYQRFLLYSPYSNSNLRLDFKEKFGHIILNNRKSDGSEIELWVSLKDKYRINYIGILENACNEDNKLKVNLLNYSRPDTSIANIIMEFNPETHCLTNPNTPKITELEILNKSYLDEDTKYMYIPMKSYMAQIPLSIESDKVTTNIFESRI